MDDDEAHRSLLLGVVGPGAAMHSRTKMLTLPPPPPHAQPSSQRQPVNTLHVHLIIWPFEQRVQSLIARALSLQCELQQLFAKLNVSCSLGIQSPGLP